jgi:(1->4)-alpha-D-glucan 1-alpha-D-glucosylmutase
MDHSLVDPDNRREVPAQLAAEPVDRPVAAYLRDWPDARVKRALIEMLAAARTGGDVRGRRVRAAARARPLGGMRWRRAATTRRPSWSCGSRAACSATCRPCAHRAWNGVIRRSLPPVAGEPWLDCLNGGGAVETHDGILRLDRCLSALPVAVVVATRGRG